MKDSGIFFARKVIDENGRPHFGMFPYIDTFRSESERFIYQDLINNPKIKPFGSNLINSNLVAQATSS